MKMLALILAAVAGALSAAADGGRPPDVTCASNLAEVVFRHPTPGRTFAFEATVSCCPRGSYIFSVADATGSATVRGRPFWTNGTVRAGDRVRISGVTVTAKHVYGSARKVSANCYSITTLARGKAPAPVAAGANGFLEGAYDNRFVRITGFLRDAFRDEIDPDYLYLIIGSEDEVIYVATAWDEAEAQKFERIVGARIAIDGICVPLMSGSRLHIGRHLVAGGIEDVRLLQPLPSDPFSAPPLERLDGLRMSRIATLGRRRVSGWVVAQWHGGRLLVDTDDERLVQASLAGDAAGPGYGRHVEIVGFPETDLYHINLTRALCRETPGGDMRAEAARPVTMDAIMTDTNGNPRIDVTLHGRPVRLRGLVRSIPSLGGDIGRIYVESSQFIVPVDASSTPSALNGVSVGCEVEIEGTCVMEVESWRPNNCFPKVNSVTIVVRTPSDVRIVSRPPWWTPGRLVGVIGALLAALTGIFAWNRSLNRLAERRGRELTEEKVARVASDMKVGERTRLAIELHDSLSQNLTGVSLEVATATKFAERDASQTLRHLDIATRSLKSCRDELRNCIWDLRNYALDEKDMNGAVRRTLAPFIDGVELVVRFNVPRERLSDNTAHALLRIVRELVQNAIRHGRAKSIKIAGCLESERILFSVADDGCGFDPNSRPGVREGHFGLQGIQERVNRFGGEMSIDSAAAKGARISISLQLSRTA